MNKHHKVWSAGRGSRAVWLMSAAVVVGLPSVAQAQSAPPASSPSEPVATNGAKNNETQASDDIVVTAQRREESLQNIPVAITALRADDLQKRGLTSIADVASMVPSLVVGEQIGRGRITLRGIGIDNISTGSEASVTLSSDGVFYSRSAAALAGMFDIERIEVLRGPQGTLYGRNATTGSVNIITKKPTRDFEGNVAATIGNYNTLDLEAAAGGPISDTLSARFSFKRQRHTGYGRNLVTGSEIDDKDSQAARAQLLFEPSNRLSILLGGDYYHSDDNNGTYHGLGPSAETAPGVTRIPTGLLIPGGFLPSNPRDIAAATDPSLTNRFYGARFDTTYKFNDTVSLRSLSAVRRSEVKLFFNVSPTGPTLLSKSRLIENSTQFSQEFQLNINTDKNKFVAGLFYFDERLYGEVRTTLNRKLLPPGGLANPDVLLQGSFKGGRLHTQAAAAYAQDTYSITPTLRFTLGARYSLEKKSVNDQDFVDLATPFSSFDAPVTAPHRIDSKIFRSFTPKVGIDFDVAPKVLLYASWAKGFKSGNFNLGNFNPPVAGQPLIPPVNPEKVSAFEGGIKSTLFDGLFRANIAGFYYDYTDLQVQKVQGTSLILQNAASAKIYGLEGEFELRPLRNRNLIFSLKTSWLHARYDKFISADPSRPGQGNPTLVDPNTGATPAFDLSGASLAQAPNYTVNLGAEYRIDLGAKNGAVTLRGESFWSDRFYFSQFNRNVTSQPSFNLLNASIGYDAPKGFYVNAYIRNILNKTVVSGATPGSLIAGGGLLIGYLQPPRTYGVTVGFNF